MAGPVDLELENHDLKIASGDFSLLNGGERVAQSIEIRLKALRGEWFIDRTFGTPWFQFILGNKMVAQSEYDAIVKAEILKPDGVNRIISFSSSFNQATRVYSIEFVADTIYGPISYEGVVP